MVKLDALADRIINVHVTPFTHKEPFMDLAARYAGMPGTVVLMSGTDLDCARYHLLGVDPWLTLRTVGRDTFLETAGASHTFSEDPFDILQTLLNQLRLPTRAFPGIHVPVAAGLMGFLAYDLKDALEELPRTAVDDLRLPTLFMVAPSVLIVHDKRTRASWLCIPERQNHWGVPSVSAILDKFNAQSRVLASTGAFRGDIARARSGFTREEYISAVEKINAYIRAGDVYQVNLSQRFETAFEGDPFGLFQSLYAMNPAPFFAYIHAKDHHIVSTSPERFIQQSGPKVETRPIKGTRPRGNTPETDAAYRQDLCASRKDDAELSMIVDLLRNDIGKVCAAGSVRVTAHKRLEAYQNVYHLVSVVEGVLQPEKDAVDLIRATFPGGSITGCPKIRAMEIIDELEPCRRHIYTGAIGYISFHDTMDLSIAIRTATVLNGKMIFSVGGGIVFDSDPADEYEETLHKGHTLMTVFNDTEKTVQRPSIAWFNGTVRNLNDVCISVMDHGLLYGYGFFETLRADNGRAKHLLAHLARFNNTWRELFQTIPPDLTWPDIIAQVLRCNGLCETTAAVKILATRGTRDAPPFDHQLLVTARPYEHRLKGKQEAGLRLLVYPEPRQTPLAAHKTLNYLYYLLAGQWAKARGADEALILNPDKSVSETNTAALLVVSNQRVIRPFSQHVLPSVMQQSVCELLDRWGYSIETRSTLLQDLYAADDVLLVNALMGAVPVLSIENRGLRAASDLFERINRQVLS
ncbi:MAG: aminodeoxychorismate synthase component I [Desulfobacterales bacterium]|jgi:para-aminobenzoate synthetase component 1|nr:aminodeoxychorismate synthase component I [Desulfobacterales bacterium]